MSPAKESAVREVIKSFVRCWNAIDAKSRGEFYTDVQLMMQFYTSTTKEYRQSLFESLEGAEKSTGADRVCGNTGKDNSGHHVICMKAYGHKALHQSGNWNWL